MPFTNAQHTAPAKLNASQWVDGNGSPKTNAWTSATYGAPQISTAVREGSHSWVFPAAQFKSKYSERDNAKGMYRTNAPLPITPGRLINIVWRGRSDSPSPMMLIFRVEFYKNGTWVAQTYNTIGPAITNQFVTQAVPVHMPDDGSADAIKIGIGAGFVSLGTTAGNYYIDKLALHDHGFEKQAGQITYDRPPKARRSFDSGSGEITISADGAWKLRGVPFVQKASYPNDGRNGAESAADSLVTHFVNGYNTAYQLNPCASAWVALPAGMKMSADMGSYMLAGACGYNDFARATRDVERMINAIGDDYISVYIDVENDAWDSFELMPLLVAAIRQGEQNANSHKRPIFAHCQSFSGAERFHPFVDFFEFKDNPDRADFGTPMLGGYDNLQGAMGYGLSWHPELTNPHSTFSFNTLHNGTRISGDIIDGVIKGGAGYSIWADRPKWTYDGRARGFETQPWWRGVEDIREIHRQMDNLWPMMDADSKNELMATFSANGLDGQTGVSKTLRKVGNEVWGAFANNSETQARTITVTTSEAIDQASLVNRFNIDSSARITGTNTLEVTLAAGTGYVGSFTVDGDVEPPDYTLSIDSPAGGTQANPVVMQPGQNHVLYDFSINTLQGVSTQVAKFEQVNNDGSLTELNRQTLTPGNASWSATPSIDYTEGMLVKVTYEALDSSGNSLAVATPKYYRFTADDTGTQRRCVTLNPTMTRGSSSTYNLADLHDGAAGTARRFVIVQQPGAGTFSVSADGLTLTIALDADAAATTCGALDIEYVI